MALIRVLPGEVANRIAAGEVVERPSSVVKELVENALDAGARHVEIELEDGGIRLVRVRDDGCGMSAEDLALCARSHATSKIATVDDLFEVASFGFRGEALASIASVSEMTVVTRRGDDELGSRLELRGSSEGEPVPAGAPGGTTVEVRNLFANVPARRRFLKRERTELAHCLETVTRLLLPEPEVSTRVTHGGRLVLEAPSVEDRPARVRTFFGDRLARELLAAGAEEGPYRLEGLVGPPALVKPHGRYQYLFLNGRFVRDAAVTAALREAYRGLVMPRDHPVAFLFLDVPPREVDVNVHPTKHEVRFRERDRVFGLVRRAVAETLAGAREARPLRLRDPGPGARRTPEPGGGDRLAAVTRELFDAGAAGTPGGASVAAEPGTPACRDAPRAAEAPSLGEGRFLHVHDSYIVVETPEGLHIVDQHALHERKLFEELLARLRADEAPVQELLVPEVVDLTAADAALLLERQEDLAALGLRIEPFGGSSVCVRSLPAAVAHVGGEGAVADVLGVLRSGGRRPPAEALLRETAAALACRAAVKFNDALAEDEIRALLRFADAHPELSNCPHGRPVAVRVTLRDLENQFQRKR